jgi:hypothetical protein
MKSIEHFSDEVWCVKKFLVLDHVHSEEDLGGLYAYLS